MNILVTGGAGYLGSTLVPLLLAEGHQVRVLDNLSHGGQSLLGVWSNPGFDFQLGDVRDSRDVENSLEGVDAVVHLAAIVGDPACSREPELARSINQDASLALFDQCRRRGVSRFVFASTCSNYGKMADPSQYVAEDSELRPLSLYAETKVAVERAILDGGGHGQMCSTCFRLATVYGVSARMRFDLTVNEFTLEMVKNGRLVVFGEQFWRPYLHVRDAARGFVRALEAPASIVGNQVFNLGSTDENYRKLDLVDLIRPLAPDATVEYVQKEEDPRDYRVSFEKVKNVLGFEVTRTVKDGVVEVARLVRNKVIQDFTEAKYRN